jgi:hypothetical protein
LYVPVIKPRANARTDRGPPERRMSAAILKMFGEGGWSMVMGYGRRWSVETAFSTYKRLYRENTMSRNIENIVRWFREIKDRTKRFYNNINSKKLKSIEELVTAIAMMHNIIRTGGEEVIPT